MSDCDIDTSDDSLCLRATGKRLLRAPREPSYIWSRKGKPFRNISLVNVSMDKGVEVVNVEGFRLEGGTLRRIELSAQDDERRSGEIERFERLLY